MNNLIRKNLEESQQLLQKINNTDCIEYSQWINEKTLVSITKYVM